MAMIDGTSGNDTLQGTPEDDYIGGIGAMMSCTVISK